MMRSGTAYSAEQDRVLRSLKCPSEKTMKLFSFLSSSSSSSNVASDSSVENDLKLLNSTSPGDDANICQLFAGPTVRQELLSVMSIKHLRRAEQAFDRSKGVAVAQAVRAEIAFRRINDASQQRTLDLPAATVAAATTPDSKFQSNPAGPLKSRREQRFTPWIFDGSLQLWRLLQPSDAPSPDTEFREAELRVLTYNVWFDGFAQQQRCLELLRLIADRKCDVVCLQEMTAATMSLFTASKFIREHYVLSAILNETFQFQCFYGVCLLWRRDIALSKLADDDVATWSNTKLLVLPTSQGRRAVCVDLTVCGQRLSVATVHLESLSAAPLRRQQLALIVEAQRPIADSLILGDFNFSDLENYRIVEGEPLENDVLKDVSKEYRDCWTRSDDRGLTFDNKRNTMFPPSSLSERMRYDRVILKSERFRLKSIEVVGDKKFTSLMDRDVFISDHYGVFSVFSISSSSSSSSSSATRVQEVNVDDDAKSCSSE